MPRSERPGARRVGVGSRERPLHRLPCRAQPRCERAGRSPLARGVPVGVRGARQSAESASPPRAPAPRTSHRRARATARSASGSAQCQCQWTPAHAARETRRFPPLFNKTHVFLRRRSEVFWSALGIRVEHGADLLQPVEEPARRVGHELRERGRESSRQLSEERAATAAWARGFDSARIASMMRDRPSKTIKNGVRLTRSENASSSASLSASRRVQSLRNPGSAGAGSQSEPISRSSPSIASEASTFSTNSFSIFAPFASPALFTSSSVTPSVSPSCSSPAHAMPRQPAAPIAGERRRAAWCGARTAVAHSAAAAGTDNSATSARGSTM